MNSQEYIDFVKSLVKPGADIMATVTAERCNLLHMAIGIVGECIELSHAENQKNFREELGDTLFFTTALREMYPAPPSKPEEMENVHTCCLTSIANEILDLVKKVTIYNKLDPLFDDKMGWLLAEMMVGISQMLDQEELPMSELRQSNVDKLTKRYKDGYSDKAAQDRADKKEGE